MEKGCPDGDECADEDHCSDDEEADEQEVERSKPKAPPKHPKSKRLVPWLPQRYERYVKAVSDPSVGVELSMKLVVTFILYSLVIAWSAYTLHTALEGGGSVKAATVEVSIASGTERGLRVELQACALAITSVPGSSSLRVTDTTLVTLFSLGNSHVSLSDNGGCVVVTCTGPAEDTGFLVSAHLEIGADVAISATHVLVQSTERSAVMLSDAPYGNLFIEAEDAVVQLDSATAYNFSAALNKGLLDVRNSRIDNGTIMVGSAAVSMRPRSDARTLLRLRVDAKYADDDDADADEEAVSNLCLSDAMGAPALRNDSETPTVALGSRAGGAGFESHIYLTRGVGTTKSKSPLGQVFVSQEVSHNNRSSANTLDTAPSPAPTTVEDGFRVWAEDLFARGAQKFRLRLLGPGMDDELGSLASRAEWFFSYHGDVHVWHPASYFWVGSVGIFHPLTARADVVLTSVMCTRPTMMPVTEAATEADTCFPSAGGGSGGGGSAGGGGSIMGIGKLHSAIWHALPDSLRKRNQSMSELYLAEHLAPAEEADAHVSVAASSRVIKFSASRSVDTDSLVLLTSERESGPFFHAAAESFLAMALIVLIVFIPTASVVLVRGYLSEKERIIEEQGLQWCITLRCCADEKAGTGGAQKGAAAAPKAKPKPTSEEVKEPEEGPAGADPKIISVAAKAAKAPAEVKEPEDGAAGADPRSTEAGAAQAKGTEAGAAQAKKGTAKRPGGDRHLTDDARITEAAKAKATRMACTKVRRGVHLLLVLDEAILQRLPEASKVDGLLGALLMVSVHFAAVLLLCLPLHLFTWLYIYNIADQQDNCATIELASGNCSGAHMRRPIFFQIFLICVEVFFLFYCSTIYLRRQIDSAFPPSNHRRMSRTRRLLFMMHVSIPLTVVFWLLLAVLFCLNAFFALAVLSYIVLGACVDPQKLMPVLLGVLSVAFVATQLPGRLKAMRDAVKRDLELAEDKVGTYKDKAQKEGARYHEAITKTLRDMGFAPTHMILLTVFSCLACTASVVFILLGCSLFMNAASIVPTLISSGLVVLSAVATCQSWEKKKTLDIGDLSGGPLKAFNKHFKESKNIFEEGHKHYKKAQSFIHKDSDTENDSGSDTESVKSNKSNKSEPQTTL